jgi:putative membrane fusion protein
LENKRLRKAKQRFEVLPGAGKRFSFKTVRQAVVFYFLLLLALVILVQLGYHWLGEQFQSWRLGIIEAEAGYMQQKAEIRGIVTRDEMLITAPVDGVILQLAAAGERAPVGFELARIGQLTAAEMQMLVDSAEPGPGEELWERIQQYWQDVFPEQDDDISDAGASPPIFNTIITIECPQAGFISYYLDSWEDRKQPLYLPDEELETNVPTGTYIMEGDLVQRGQPILKIIDNWQWYFSAVIPFHPGRMIAALEQVELTFEFAPGEPVEAKLISSELDETAQEVRLTYQIDKQLPGFDLLRLTTASLLYEQKSGIIVPEAAVFKKENLTGVYLNQGGRVIFAEVTVLEKQEDYVMVEGLQPGSLIITRPDLVTEGQRLN